MADIGDEIGERIAEHGPAAVPDMHRAGRIGRNIFDIDFLPRFSRKAGGKARPLLQSGAQKSRENGGLQANVEKAGAGHLGLGDVVVLGKSGGKLGSKLARISETCLGLLRIDHGSIDREIAMRVIARRLDHETGEVEIGWQAAVRDDPLQNRGDASMKIGVNVHRPERGCERREPRPRSLSISDALTPDSDASASRFGNFSTIS